MSDAVEELMHGNRVVNAYERMRKQIAQRIKDGLTTAEKVEETRKALDMDLEEYVKFQEVKSLAVAQGLLTVDEGQSVYAALGNTPDVFNGQPCHIKSVLTSFFGELLKWKMAGCPPLKRKAS